MRGPLSGRECARKGGGCHLKDTKDNLWGPQQTFSVSSNGVPQNRLWYHTTTNRRVDHINPHQLHQLTLWP
jgi:hypothetical protein